MRSPSGSDDERERYDSVRSFNANWRKGSTLFAVAGRSRNLRVRRFGLALRPAVAADMTISSTTGSDNSPAERNDRRNSMHTMVPKSRPITLCSWSYRSVSPSDLVNVILYRLRNSKDLPQRPSSKFRQELNDTRQKEIVILLSAVRGLSSLSSPVSAVYPASVVPWLSSAESAGTTADDVLAARVTPRDDDGGGETVSLLLPPLPSPSGRALSTALNRPAKAQLRSSSSRWRVASEGRRPMASASWAHSSSGN
mmetsp:Transcript_23526/g.67575  ORF Transcript_23526/g.67575 Transcript_23526/m.67575 type:complete len:254 (-) Transcript_23526:169-930(-)